MREHRCTATGGIALVVTVAGTWEGIEPRPFGRNRVPRRTSSDVAVVDVAPAPVFARLKRPGDRVPDDECMSASVAQRGRVATPDVPARKAEPQMYPDGAKFQTLLAPLGGPWRYRTNQHQMSITNGCHDSLRSYALIPGCRAPGGPRISRAASFGLPGASQEAGVTMSGAEVTVGGAG
jgi:hypothetical protein